MSLWQIANSRMENQSAIHDLLKDEQPVEGMQGQNYDVIRKYIFENAEKEDLYQEIGPMGGKAKIELVSEVQIRNEEVQIGLTQL